MADINAAIVGGGSGDGFFTVGGTLGSSVATVPEPTTLSMVMSTCIVGMAVYRWRRRQVQPA